MYGTFAGIFRVGEELGVLQCVFDGLDLGMGLRNVFGNPPAVNAAFWKRVGSLDQLLFVDAFLDHLGQHVDPGFRGNVRWPFRPSR